MRASRENKFALSAWFAAYDLGIGSWSSKQENTGRMMPKGQQRKSMTEIISELDIKRRRQSSRAIVASADFGFGRVKQIIDSVGIYSSPHRPDTLDTISFSDYGFHGVVLIFLLSGYLITWMLLESKNGENHFGDFYKNRVFKIWPLMLGAQMPYIAMGAAVAFGKTGLRFMSERGEFFRTVDEKKRCRP